MIKCPSCGADVSSEAIACPKCGHPLRSTGSSIDTKDPVHVIGIILAIVILLGLIGYGISTCHASLS